MSVIFTNIQHQTTNIYKTENIRIYIKEDKLINLSITDKDMIYRVRTDNNMLSFIYELSYKDDPNIIIEIESRAFQTTEVKNEKKKGWFKK